MEQNYRDYILYVSTNVNENYCAISLTPFAFCTYSVSGGQGGGGYNDDILMFDPESGSNGQWRRIGTMKMKRRGHAMSVINYNQIKDYCM